MTSLRESGAPGTVKQRRRGYRPPTGPDHYLWWPGWRHPSAFACTISHFMFSWPQDASSPGTPAQNDAAAHMNKQVSFVSFTSLCLSPSWPGAALSQPSCFAVHTCVNCQAASLQSSEDGSGSGPKERSVQPASSVEGRQWLRPHSLRLRTAPPAAGLLAKMCSPTSSAVTRPAATRPWK